MAKLGSKKRPAVVRVHTMEKAQEMVDLCQEHGWQVIAGVDPDKPEDLTDVEKLLNLPSNSPNPPTIVFPAQIGRNAPCACGSGLKYKKCCGQGK
jgi:SWIM/SEC-C metal-binding protein